MKARVCLLLFAAAFFAASVAAPDHAMAGGHRHAARCHTGCGHGCGHGFGLHGRGGNGEAWNGAYYHVMWGQPVALVVPPTAEYQTHWNWGVAQTAVTPIWPQFSRAYPGPYYGPNARLLPTPAWPSSTDQFGVYYVRGPW